MPYDPNPNWTAAADKTDQAPVYLLLVDGTSKYFATGPVQDGGPGSLVMGMEIPTTSQPDVDILGGSRAPAVVTVRLVDVDGEVTKLVGTEAPGAEITTLKNRRATIYGGYSDLAFSDYPVVFEGRIASVTMLGETSYQFILADVTYLLDGTFNNEQTGTATTDEAPAFIEGNVVNVWRALVLDFYADASFPVVVSPATPYLPDGVGNPTHGFPVREGFSNAGNAIDGDVDTFASGEDNGILDCLFPVSVNLVESGRIIVDIRAVNGGATIGISLNEGASYEDMGSVSSEERETFLGFVLQSVDIGAVRVRVTASASSVIQVWRVQLERSIPSGLQAGALSALLDDTDLALLRDTWHPDTNVRAVFTGEHGAQTWLEREVYRVFQCLPVSTGAGLLSLRFVAPPLMSDVEITENEIVSVRTWRRELDSHLNQFLYEGDEDPDNKTLAILYDSLAEGGNADDAADLAATKELIEYNVASRLLRLDLFGDGLAEEMAGRARLLWQRAPVIMSLNLTFRSRMLLAGDSVMVTDRNIPDISTGVRGLVKRLMFVLSVSIDYPSGIVILSLLDLPWKRYGMIAADSQNPYDTATADERESYTFLANEGTRQLSDGSAAYRWL